MAQVLLKKDKDWSPARVESAFNAGDDHHVELNQKIPVHVTYFTLRVNEDGSFTSFNDLYGHDARMAAVLNGGGYPAAPAFQEELVSQQQWRQPRRRGGRAGNDFTRALFGF